ncbi:MAG: hypothetical protein COA94_04825 [Rickettsiales bacterium]|nr:MAG: hypothetical protein COA94_04825 [Rickettsiales bacterium]
MLDESVLIYNGYDVANTLQCKEEIWKVTKDSAYTYDFTMRLLNPLMYMMTRGVKVDFKKLDILRKSLHEQIDRKQLRLNELCGRELNVNSPKDCQTYFYVEKNIPPYYNSKRVGGQYKKSVTTDDKAMQRIARGTAARKGLYEATLVQDIRGMRKMVGTYLDMEYDKDGRLRCSYNPRGTKFGRLSSSKTIFGTGMNMQNLPLEFKGFIVPDPGNLMWEIDKKGAEWVAVAYLSGDANMIKVVEEGLDPHAYTAHLMTGVPIELIQEEDAIIGHTNDPNLVSQGRAKLIKGSLANQHAYEQAVFLPRTMTIRQCGKKSNHGLNYDEGYKMFALINEMLEGDAKRICHMYKHIVYPGVNLWHKSIQDKLQQDRTLTNCFGRSMRFLGRWEEKLFKEAYAFLPQSTVVDIVNTGMEKFYYDRRPDMCAPELLAQVHDSLLGQSPLDGDYAKMARVFKTIGDYMEPTIEYGGREFTIQNELKVSTDNWRDGVEVDIYAGDEELGRQIQNIVEK